MSVLLKKVKNVIFSWPPIIRSIGEVILLSFILAVLFVPVWANWAFFVPLSFFQIWAICFVIMGVITIFRKTPDSENLP